MVLVAGLAGRLFWALGFLANIHIEQTFEECLQALLMLLRLHRVLVNKSNYALLKGMVRDQVGA